MSSITVLIPQILTRFTEGKSTVNIEDAATVGETVHFLLEAHPELEPHILTSTGHLRQHLRLLHNGRIVVDPLMDPRLSDDSVVSGDTLRVLQAVSGG